jgi:hypothetical protein
VTKVQPPRPAALPRQQAGAPRWSAEESAVAAEVSRRRRMLEARPVATRLGVDTIPTEVTGRSSC